MAHRGGWFPFVLVIVSVAAEMVLAGGPVDAASRPGTVTAVVGLAALAVGCSLVWSMGLGRERRGLKLAMLIPIVLSCLLVVVLILESDYRARRGG